MGEFPFISLTCVGPVEGGRVHIRDWRVGKSSRTNTKRRPAAAEAKKTRPCWFYQHHPQRCPLLPEHCVFAHGADDLRASTRPLKKIKNDFWWWPITSGQILNWFKLFLFEKFLFFSTVPSSPRLYWLLQLDNIYVCVVTYMVWGFF